MSFRILIDRSLAARPVDTAFCTPSLQDLDAVGAESDSESAAEDGGGGAALAGEGAEAAKAVLPRAERMLACLPTLPEPASSAPADGVAEPEPEAAPAMPAAAASAAPAADLSAPFPEAARRACSRRCLCGARFPGRATSNSKLWSNQADSADTQTQNKETVESTR